MKIVREGKVINLDKFDKVECRESLMDNGFPVEAIRVESGGGIFGGTKKISEEIVRFTEESFSKMLVKDISEKWSEDCKSFNVDEWIKNNCK